MLIMAEDKCTGTRSTSKNKVDAQLAFFLRGGEAREFFAGKVSVGEFFWGSECLGTLFGEGLSREGFTREKYPRGKSPEKGIVRVGVQIPIQGSTLLLHVVCMLHRGMYYE